MPPPSPMKKSIQYGDHLLTLETGEVARQASGAVMASLGDTVVLATVVADRSGHSDRDFFPLTVDYQEKTYAAGRIPGGFFRREGRPGEKEILTCRLIDRPMRPMFPKGFRNETQIMATVISVDPDIDPDIPAMVGASAAVACSGIPFNGPIGAARVGYADGQYLLNPGFAALAESELDLVVAGTSSAVLMVESEAQELPEEVMLGAVTFGHERMQPVIGLIRELAAEAGRPAWNWTPPAKDSTLAERAEALVEDRIADAYRIVDKAERQGTLGDLRRWVETQILGSSGEGGEPQWTAQQVADTVASIEKKVVRGRILDGKPRIDGRDRDAVREVTTRVGVLPRTHGSALFTRGETQALVAITLGNSRDSQIIDALEGERRDPFMFHYNFPPYCVGETGRNIGPRRREIGHGRLARRGISAVMPSLDDFPYVIRVVSEITESNGSSSMASVCGSSMALMDAGVPIRAPVAGIAMGLVKENDRFAVLSDIMGDEDHLGDMDFKVAGTARGVNALQMDIKIEGITHEIMQQALTQAHAGRMHILERMADTIREPRKEMSEYAPRIITIKIDPEKIRDVIGRGGATIRSITEETGAAIDVSDDGTIKIASVDALGGQEARRRIEQITADVEVGVIYEGKVQKIMDFGAFVNILPGKDGLVHISQISNERVENVNDKLREGQTVRVKVLEVDKQGRVRLSMKAVDGAS